MFECSRLEVVRMRGWSKIEEVMPPAMKLSVEAMSNSEKTILILSGYGNRYIKEWEHLYGNTAVFVYELYNLRNNLYAC